MTKYDRNAPCWCGSGKKYKHCHEAFDEKIREFEVRGAVVPDRSIIKTPKDVEGIRKSAVINIAVLDEVADKIHAGMSTQEIDDIVYNTTVKMGGIPADLHYEGYPKSVCTSVNDQVCHGIPSDKVILKDGDIVNVDCSTILNGYFSDSSRMFYSVVREIGGHGCGCEFHEDPYVSYVSKPGTEMLMVPGMCFTIEPMVNMGTDRIYEDDSNGWSIYTDDGKPSAQWEVQVLVTDDGYELITY